MTAVNFLVLPDALHVISDAAFYTPDGVVVEVHTKVHPIPHLSAVVAGRGPRNAVPLFALVGARARSFDELMARLEVEFEKFCVVHFHGDERLMLNVGGYSEKRGRFEFGFISSHPDLAERNADTPASGAVINPRGFQLVHRGPGLYVAPAPREPYYLKVFGRQLETLAAHRRRLRRSDLDHARWH
jgi:hypothetical protein